MAKFKKGDWDPRFTKRGTRVWIKKCHCGHPTDEHRHLATIHSRALYEPGRFRQTLDGSGAPVAFRQEEIELANTLDRLASEV
jgi:hypothetical protein